MYVYMMCTLFLWTWNQSSYFKIRTGWRPSRGCVHVEVEKQHWLKRFTVVNKESWSDTKAPPCCINQTRTRADKKETDGCVQMVEILKINDRSEWRLFQNVSIMDFDLKKKSITSLLQHLCFLVIAPLNGFYPLKFHLTIRIVRITL